jgi:hypothetical protein
VFRHAVANVDAPDWAKDMHTGHMQRGSAEGVAQFMSEGLNYGDRTQVYQVHKSVDAFYVLSKQPRQQPAAAAAASTAVVEAGGTRAVATGVKEKNKNKKRILSDDILVGKECKILSAIDGQPIVSQVRAKTPCGGKPGTWFVRCASSSSSGSSYYWLKEIRSSNLDSVRVQLEFNMLKEMAGVPAIQGLKFHHQGFLLAADMGQGTPPVPLDKLESSSYQILWPQIMPALLLRHIFRISDSHFGNFIFVKQTNRVYSCDEMTVKAPLPTPGHSPAQKQQQEKRPVLMERELFSRVSKPVLQSLLVWLQHPSGLEPLLMWMGTVLAPLLRNAQQTKGLVALGGERLQSARTLLAGWVRRWFSMQQQQQQQL